jgi:hypothetical protein
MRQLDLISISMWGKSIWPLMTLCLGGSGHEVVVDKCGLSSVGQSILAVRDKLGVTRRRGGAVGTQCWNTCHVASGWNSDIKASAADVIIAKILP